MKRMLIFSISVFILAFVMTTEIAMPEDYPYRCPKMPEEYHKIPIEKPPPTTSNSIKALLGEWGGTWILISGVYLPIREARLKIYQIYPDKKFTVIYGCGNESGGWWTTRQAELQGNKLNRLLP